MLFFTLIIFSGAVISIVTSVGSLFREQSTALKYATFLVFLSIGLYLSAVAIWLSPIRDSFISIQYFHFPCASTIGPLLYLYLQTILNRNWKFNRYHLLLFLPSLFFLIELIPFYSLPTAEKFKIRDAVDQGQNLSGLALYIKLSRSFIYLQTLISIVYFCYQTQILFTLKSIRENRLILHFYILTRFTIITLFISFFFEIFYRVESYKISATLLGLSISCIIAYLHILIILYPKGNSEINQAYTKIKYESSNLRNLDRNFLIQKLASLMEDEKLYRNENLTMGEIARKLNVNNHQLSELLNADMNISFYDYLNKYRVNEARILLEKRKELTIIKIAFDVGFKSQSTFYSAFKRELKMTPNDYRISIPKKEKSPNL